MKFRNIRLASLVTPLLWTLLLIFVAAGVNVVGIHIIGNVSAWRRWLSVHGVWFLIWRICLYGLTAYGWWWTRERVRRREPNIEALLRLRRVEVAGLVAILVVEGVTFIHAHFT